MRAPRFTLRVLMIGVAFAALATWGDSLYRRSVELDAMATKHWTNLLNLSDSVGRRMGGRRNAFAYRLTLPDKAKREIGIRWYDYEEHMFLKYRRAARLPWLPISPDPPPPAEPW
jgi:hypothetical protein